MSTPVSKTVVVAELTTYDGHRIHFPLAYPQSTWFTGRGHEMTQHMQASLQKEVIDQGQLLDVMRMSVPAEFVERRLEIEATAKDMPPRREGFHLFTATLPDGRCHSFLPALGIEILSAGSDAVDTDVREHIRLEHMRHGRFSDVRKMIACQWYQEARTWQFVMHLDVPGPDERARESVPPLLPEVAMEMRAEGLAAAGLDEAVADLANRVEGRFSRSVLVTGPESSGKTSLIRAYARDRARRGSGAVWETSAARLLQGLTKEGGWQKNLAVLCNELYDQALILYVGHLPELFEVGQYEGNTVSIGAALRDQLQRGRILLLAEATEAELARLELHSAGFAALFQESRMPKWDEHQQRQVVMEAIRLRSREHAVEVTADAVEEALLLQRRYSPYSGFPGKPIRFLESLLLQQQQRGEAVARGHVMKAFCAETGIPQFLLDARIPLDTDAMHGFFRQRIFGQSAAIDLVCDMLLSIKATMTRAGKPIASLLLIGPTGVGKTETAKALAEYMFGDPQRMLRFDMSEYPDAASVLRLTGDLGTDEGTLVTRIRQQPFSVVLFDEIEKAHQGFFDLLLQILGEGRLTGGKGQLANFCSAVIVMTSNIGAAEMQRHPMGLHPVGNDRDGVARHFEHAVQHHFRPELFNRLDHIVPFSPLTNTQRRPIIERELALLRGREGIRERAMTLALEEAVVDQLCAGVQDDRYGARQMQRVIQDRLLFPLARVLSGMPYARPVLVSVRGGGSGVPVIDCSADALPVNLPAAVDADHAARQRRQLQKIIAGPMWTGLVNRRYTLQLQKQKMTSAHDEQRFWELHGKTYTALNGLQADADALLTDILRVEAQYLQAETDADAIHLTSWERRYMTFKRAVLGLSQPEANRCTIGIYGPVQAVEVLRSLYAGIAVRMEFEQRQQMVKADQDAFRKIALPPSPHARPDQAPLIGYEIECRGDSAYYLFSGEDGVWRVNEEEKKHLDLFVTVSRHALEAHPTPPLVHRKSFFEGRPVRRQVKQGELIDAKEEWRCPYPSAADLHPLLAARWRRLADGILTGEDQA